MKLVKTASGKRTIKISKKEWESIGAKQGWTKEAVDAVTPVPVTELAGPSAKPGDAFKDSMTQRMRVALLKAIRGTGVNKDKEAGILQEFFAGLDKLPIAKTKELVQEMGENKELQEGVEDIENTQPELFSMLEENETGPTHPDNPNS